MIDPIDIVTNVIHERLFEYADGGCDGCCAEILAEAIVEALGLIRRDRWVPIDEDGDRWAPRSHASALEDFSIYRAGSPHNLDLPGLTHIEHEASWSTEWKLADD